MCSSGRRRRGRASPPRSRRRASSRNSLRPFSALLRASRQLGWIRWSRLEAFDNRRRARPVGVVLVERIVERQVLVLPVFVESLPVSALPVSTNQVRSLRDRNIGGVLIAEYAGLRVGMEPAGDALWFAFVVGHASLALVLL